MAEPVMIMIEIDGGVVAGVYTAGVPVRFVIVDYHPEGAPKAETRAVDGVPAFVNGGDAIADGPAVLKAFEAWDGPEAPAMETKPQAMESAAESAE